jgi:hypothetical protein
VHPEKLWESYDAYVLIREAPAALKALTQSLASKSATDRELARSILVRAFCPAPPHGTERLQDDLWPLLFHEDDSVVEAALSVLELKEEVLRGKVLRRVRWLLQHSKSAGVRAAAMWLCANSGKSSEVLGDIAAAAGDPDFSIRTEAMFWVAELGHPKGPDFVRRGCSDPDAWVRYSCAEWLLRKVALAGRLQKSDRRLARATLDGLVGDPEVPEHLRMMCQGLLRGAPPEPRR